jgi:hypothetical protein
MLLGWPLQKNNPSDAGARCVSTGRVDIDGQGAELLFAHQLGVNGRHARPPSPISGS